nr:hypothetical protein [candidate division Zixibacteria bacterium]
MADYNIDDFFGEFLDDRGEIPPESILVFRRLIKLTLEFRDNWKSRTGRTLTVGETRRALDIYLEAMNSGFLPSDMEPMIEELVRFWIKNINHGDY